MIETVKKYSDCSYKLQEFDSMNEVANYIENTPNIQKYDLTKSSYLRSERSFLGIGNFDGIISRLKQGDNKMTTMYLDKIKTLSNEDFENNENFHMDIEGVAYDMGAVVAGEPECCINTGSPKTKPYIKIFIDTGYCGDVSPDIIANRGIAVFQLITNLLAMNYIVDVQIIHFIDTYGSKYAQTVKLSTEYLVTSQLAFGGTCEFFRVVTWLLTAIQKKEYDYTGGGRSMPSSSVIESMKKEGLYIPSGYTDTRFNHCNLKQAIEYVTQIYNEYVEAQCK